MKKLVVLISNKGTGTNLQAIIDGINSRKIKAKIIAVISDTKDARGLERAKKHNLKIRIVSKKEDLLSVLKKLNPDYICLAGWKQIILDEAVLAFPNRFINTHPGLIPDTIDGVVKNPDATDALWNKAKLTDKAIQNFLDQKKTYAGVTNHLLSLEVDSGPVLGRCFEKIKEGDTVDSLYKRLKIKENKLYVDVLKRLTKQNDKTILITDGGGRGAALVDKYGQSKFVKKILVIPGNDLMQVNTKRQVLTFPNLKTTSVKEILEIVKSEKVDLVDVAQDNAVQIGLVNELLKLGVQVVGPTKEAGQIEWDKAWSREFMKKYNIPSPEFHIFNSQKDGIDFAKKNPKKKWFIKASGLAEGKGAIPGGSLEQTLSAIKQMNKFGGSGEKFLLEQWMEGEEFSAFALSDGESFKVVGFAQDHKRVFDGDTGPNTGGMGCVSNPLIVDQKIKSQVNEIFQKTIEGMGKEGRLYKGVLYLGGMVVKGRVYIIEFNARWGDPEAQVIIPSIKNDFLKIADSIIFGKINKTKIEVDKKIRVVVAATAKGYPADYSSVKGKRVKGIGEALKEGVKVYGAGIKRSGKNYVVNGGRVLYLVGEGKNIVDARKKAYKAMELINIEGDNLHYRSDIGWRDSERLNK